MDLISDRSPRRFALRDQMTPLDGVPTPEDLAISQEEGREPPHATSLTAVADEALESGIAPRRPAQARVPEVPGEDDKLRVGDPEVDPMENELSGEEVPGASTATPDQNDTDEVGRVYGVTDQDAGALTSSEELLQRRDAHRWELDPRSKDPVP